MGGTLAPRGVSPSSSAGMRSISNALTAVVPSDNLSFNIARANLPSAWVLAFSSSSSKSRSASRTMPGPVLDEGWFSERDDLSRLRRRPSRREERDWDWDHAEWPISSRLMTCTNTPLLFFFPDPDPLASAGASSSGRSRSSEGEKVRWKVGGWEAKSCEAEMRGGKWEVGEWTGESESARSESNSWFSVFLMRVLTSTPGNEVYPWG